ncbi:MAG TPA: hypothetical protein VFT87_02790 [Candidatus Saccharimonadales bacterium]|nr:hypothetical protein [Candidatus Saccharimonadales bacterium]
MSNATHIIKRVPGLSEPFDERKLFTSIYAACLSVGKYAGEAEVTAERICHDLAPWLHTKLEVTSADVRTQAAKFLQRYNPDAAYMYSRHRIIE